MRLADRAFNSLTQKQKDVWEPIMRDCLTQYTTAVLLGISREAVKDRLNKAKKRFKTFIKENKR